MSKESLIKMGMPAIPTLKEFLDSFLEEGASPIPYKIREIEPPKSLSPSTSEAEALRVADEFEDFTREVDNDSPSKGESMQWKHHNNRKWQSTDEIPRFAGDNPKSAIFTQVTDDLVSEFGILAGMEFGRRINGIAALGYKGIGKKTLWKAKLIILHEEYFGDGPRYFENKNHKWSHAQRKKVTKRITHVSVRKRK